MRDQPSETDGRPMQYLSLALAPERGWRRPGGFPRETIHYANLLGDGSAVYLAEYRGERAAVADQLVDHYEPIRYHVSRLGENTLAYLHFEPTAVEADLLRIVGDHPIVVDMPIYLGDEDRLRLTVVGSTGVIRDALQAIPDGFDVSVEKVYRQTLDDSEYHYYITP